MGERNNILLAVSLIAAMGVGTFAGTLVSKPPVLAEECKTVWNVESFHGNLSTSWQRTAPKIKISPTPLMKR